MGVRVEVDEVEVMEVEIWVEVKVVVEVGRVVRVGARAWGEMNIEMAVGMEVQWEVDRDVGVGMEVKPEPCLKTRTTVGIFNLTCWKQQLGHISVGKR